MTLRRMLSRVVPWHTVGVQQILAALCQMGGVEQGYALDERRALYLSDFAWYKAFPGFPIDCPGPESYQGLFIILLKIYLFKRYN